MIKDRSDAVEPDYHPHSKIQWKHKREASTKVLLSQFRKYPNLPMFIRKDAEVIFMFGSDITRYSKTTKKSISESPKDDELESYLQERNATIGEKTKSIAESKEDKAMEEYMRLRSKAYGDAETSDQKQIDPPPEDLQDYLSERNKALNEELTPEEKEDAELEAYLRERNQIMDE